MAPTYYTMLAQPQTLDPDAGRVLRETHWSAAEAIRLSREQSEHAEAALQAVGVDLALVMERKGGER